VREKPLGGTLAPTSAINGQRKSEQGLIRLKDSQIDMARRQVAQIDAIITDLDCMATAL
jgi:hypothetical protein